VDGVMRQEALGAPTKKKNTENVAGATANISM
jgi:hypothetical protein